MRSKTVYPEAPVFLESVRSIGYSFESAMADIIDNSISKKATDIDVYFDSISPMYVAIVDNGLGIPEDELEDAMRYGSKSSLASRERDDLGRFGLGLKMASLSQCRKLTVVSKQEDNIVGAEWDLDNVQDWLLKFYNEDECKGLPGYDILCSHESGTLVLWRNFDHIETTANPVRLFDKKIEIARKHLSLVFHRYLSSESVGRRLVIRFNNDPLKPIDPFLTSNAATQRLEETHIRMGGSVITVKPYILPYASKLSAKEKRQLEETADLKLNQGFYIYRNRRLIVWGSWMRLLKQEELKRLARIRIDIPNDLDSQWEIDIKKSVASLPEDIKDKLKSIVLKATGRSEDVYRYRGRKVIDDKLEHVWNLIDNRGSVSYKINRDTELFRRVYDSIPESEKSYFNSLMLMLEDSFPYRDVYFRFAKASDKSKDPVSNVISDEKLLEVGDQMMTMFFQQGLEPQVAFDKLKQIDFFKNHNDVLMQIGASYGLK